MGSENDHATSSPFKGAITQREEHYIALIENSLTGIYIDQAGRIVFANGRFAEIYGYQREEIIGIESWRLVHPEDRPLTDEIRAKRLRGEAAPSEYEARGLTKDGRTIWIQRRNTDIKYQGGPAILGNAVDVTKQKMAEEQLREKKEELENLINIVAHDIKTPLIAIQGFTSRLLKHYGTQLDDRARRYLETIMASGRRMEALLSDLRALSNVGRVTLTPKRVSSRDIVQGIAAELHDRIKHNRVELVISENLPRIVCDRDKLAQVFQNLLVNAIRFTKTKKNPRIEIGYEDKGAFHQFFVRDNGVGINPVHHRKIFKMFHRSESVHDEEATGLGLAIVDRIVSLHGGRVWVESEEGKGATFYFTVPKDLRPEP
jgi:PAS domain S-box-containing protein